jgi:ankyrin repeat protein
MDAAWRGCAACTEVLLEAGAGIDSIDPAGFTALMWAESNGRFEVVDRLIAARASIDLADKRELTTLMHAAWSGHTRTV